ncbi:MAG: hypothetical protein J7M13_00095 [Synergistetes bacterium]|nr:hypothetical protein [Synergistota bacterium]
MEALSVSSLRASLRYEEVLALKGNPREDRVASLYDTLRLKDPKLARDFLTMVSFLKEVAPEMVDDFLDLVDQAVKSDKKAPVSESSAAMVESLSFKLDLKIGVVEKQDDSGDVISTRLLLKLKIDYRREVKAVKKMDPIVLDMKGDGIKLTGLKNPAEFDIDGDGRKEKVSFVEGDDAFLFLDLNMNRFLDNGWELIGDQWGFKNGFEMLKTLDFNKDNAISPEDPVYKLLYIFQDLNGDRKVEPFEIRSLKEAGIFKLDLSYRSVSIKLNNTDRLIAISSYKSTMHSLRLRMADAVLGYAEG